MPSGVSVRLTIEGPAFVTASGMTLYSAPSPCTDDRNLVVQTAVTNDGDLGFAVKIPLQRSCIEKRPPLLAAADAKPIGEWTIKVRPDGARQWAFAGQPLHTSIKDKAPGDVNGSYPFRMGRPRPLNIASATFAGTPAGISARDTAQGLALINHVGKTLYFADPDAKVACTGACARAWLPLAAPALASTEGLAADWSIVTRKDGQKQWAHSGRPLYTYVHDAAAHGEQFFGDTFGSDWGSPVTGWRVALLMPAPPHPAEVTVQTLSGESEVQNFGLPRTVYADTKGMTLYTVHCMYESGLDCDDVGDGARYWLSFCGGAERCTKNWRTLAAPSGATGAKNVWSVIKVNPRNPFEPVTADSGSAVVWAYRGRPVFTYANDRRPGDYNGDDNGFGTTGDGLMQARPILAYADERVGAPVMMLSKSDVAAGR